MLLTSEKWAVLEQVEKDDHHGLDGSTPMYRERRGRIQGSEEMDKGERKMNTKRGNYI